MKVEYSKMTKINFFHVCFEQWPILTVTKNRLWTEFYIKLTNTKKEKKKYDQIDPKFVDILKECPFLLMTDKEWIILDPYEHFGGTWKMTCILVIIVTKNRIFTKFSDYTHFAKIRLRYFNKNIQITLSDNEKKGIHHLKGL